MASYKLPVLSEKRHQRGWTQVQLATAAQLTLRTVQSAERGASMSPATTRKLARALDCHWEDLLQHPLF